MEALHKARHPIHSFDPKIAKTGLIDGQDSKLTRKDLLALNRELITQLKSSEHKKWDTATAKLEKRITLLSKEKRESQQARMAAENKLFGKENRISHLENELQIESERLAAKCQQVKELEHRLESEARQARAEKGMRLEMERRLQSFEIEIDRLQGTHEKLRGRLRERQCEEDEKWGGRRFLETRVKELEGEVTGLKKELKGKNKVMRNEKIELESLETKCKIFENKVFGLEEEKKILESQLEERSKQICRITHKLERVGVQEVELKAVSKDNLRLREELEIMRQQVLIQ